MRTRFLSVAGILITFIGCGGNDLGTVSASGVVTWNGSPVPGANVTFLREAGGGPAAFAVTDAAGHFELRTASQCGAIPGHYKVLIQRDNSLDFKIPDGVSRQEYMEQNGLRPRPLLPVRYSQVEGTPLQFEIFKEAAKNEYQVNLVD